MVMTAPDADSIRACLPGDVNRLVVAFSGGVDSTVLLHLAAQTGLALNAVHIHHGLQSAADDWAAHCQRFCDSRGIPLSIEKVAVQPSGEGIEAAAREARYEALARAITSGACLLTGHHADDQAETLLLRILRGTGPDGLRGVEACRRLGAGWLVRPLLDCTRAEIEAVATQAGLDWIEDPSNASVAQDRNYLRSQILPVLRQRWPKLAMSFSRLAGLAGEQRTVLTLLLDEKLRGLCADETGPLALDALAAMPQPMQAAVLRAWISHAGMRPPSQQRLYAGLRALVSAKEDRTPKLEWPQGQVLRHGDWLYRLPVAAPVLPQRQQWSMHSAAALAWQGTVGWMPQDRDEFTVPESLRNTGLSLRGPEPGERVTLPGRPQKLISEYAREAGILPWWRAALPVVQASDGRVLAIGVLGLTKAGAEQLDANAWRFVWNVVGGAADGDLAYVCRPDSVKC